MILRRFAFLLLVLASGAFARDVQLARSFEIGEGIAAFRPAGYQADANPSFSLESEPRRWF